MENPKTYMQKICADPRVTNLVVDLVKEGVFPASTEDLSMLKAVLSLFNKKFVYSLFFNKETRANTIRLWKLLDPEDLPRIIEKIAEHDMLVSRWNSLNAEMQEIEQALSLV